MPTTTSGYYYADGTTPMSAEDISAAEATAAQGVIDGLITNNRQIQTYIWADSAERNAQTGMAQGDQGYQVDDNSNYRYNGASWIVEASSGLVPAIPTAATNATISATGDVTFTNVASVSLSGVFGEGDYQVKGFIQNLSAAVPLLRLRASGVDNTSANYDKQRLSGVSVTASAAQSIAQTSWDMGVGAFAGLNLISLDLHRPGQAAATVATFTNAATPNPMTTSGGYSAGTLQHRLSTAYDGITFYSSTGNISGRIRVYRYN